MRGQENAKDVQNRSKKALHWLRCHIIPSNDDVLKIASSGQQFFTLSQIFQTGLRTNSHTTQLKLRRLRTDFLQIVVGRKVSIWCLELSNLLWRE